MRGYGLLKGEFGAKMTIKGVGCYGQEMEGVFGHSLKLESMIFVCHR